MFEAMLFAALLHPVHETLTEVQWNDQEHVLEVAIRLDVLDEQWIARRTAKGRDREIWALQYLQTAIVVDPDMEKPDQAPLPTYRWIGSDEEGSHVWWYVEIMPPDRKAPRRIRQQMLFERSHNYTNRVLVLGGKRSFSLNLTAQKPIGSLVESAKRRDHGSEQQ